MGSLEDDLTEYHRMNKRDEEIASLKAELAAKMPATTEFEMRQLRAELAEWKERHPYGEVDLDMAIEAETKDLKLRIDTLEGAQIDYEVQCAAKDARIKEEFDKYCRNLTELAQVHKESCVAKDARIAALSTALNRIANGTRFTSDETLRAIHKVTTEILGEAYEPFDVKMP